MDNLQSNKKREKQRSKGKTRNNSLDSDEKKKDKGNNGSNVGPSSKDSTQPVEKETIAIIRKSQTIGKRLSERRSTQSTDSPTAPLRRIFSEPDTTGKDKVKKSALKKHITSARVTSVTSQVTFHDETKDNSKKEKLSKPKAKKDRQSKERSKSKSDSSISTGIGISSKSIPDSRLNVSTSEDPSFKAIFPEENSGKSKKEPDVSTDWDTDPDDTAAAFLWNRVKPTQGLPTVPGNEENVTKVGDINENDIALTPNDDEDNLEKKDDLEDTMEVLKESTKRKKYFEENETKKTIEETKLWKRRLWVVLMFNFLMRYRKKFVTVNELVGPVGIFATLMFGMTINTDQRHQSLQDIGRNSNTTKSDLDPYGRVGIDTFYSSFCSNQDYCNKQSDRHYCIVYSPRNKFTEDLMDRVMKILELETDPDIIHMEAQKHGSEDAMSVLLGVNNSIEVEEECTRHWEQENDRLLELKKNNPEKKTVVQLLRYPVGIIFSFDAGLIMRNNTVKIENDQDLPRELLYTIRTHYSEISNTVEGYPFTEHDANVYTKTLNTENSPYITTGIIGLQMAIDMAFSEKIVNNREKTGHKNIHVGNHNIEPTAFFRQFSKEPALKLFNYPTYKGRDLRVRVWVAITMSIILSYATCDISLAQLVVREQQTGSIELLKLHGMTTGMRWAANLIITGFLRSLTALALTAILNYNVAGHAKSQYPSPVMLWLFLWMHGCSVTCFNYFITIGIRKPELSGLIAVSVGFITMLIPLQLFDDGYINRYINVLLCLLLPQWNLANGIYYYLRFELYEEGLDWYDFPVMIDTETHRMVSLPMSCNLFLYSIMMYMALTIYLDHVLPREFSPRQKWSFLCEGLRRKPPAETTSTRPITRSDKPAVYESTSQVTSRFGPRFRNVTLREHRSKTLLLDNVSIDIYQDEVTCIVGQTGSGKSHLLNLVAGVSKPTTGFVDVEGLQVDEYHDITGRFVSLCPQKKLLIDSLSVEDHIRLCCMLHGASYSAAKSQATFLLHMFGLSSMRRHDCKGLTISDTKKLLVAMSVSKSPSILLLDNPVDQLDSEASFQFWKLLQELKPKRSIIVTCTKLEEAELYGDRIAIMSKGKLICYGSPSYLQRAYGIGSILNLQITANTSPNMEGITSVLRKHLHGTNAPLLETKGASLHKDTLQFILPADNFFGGLIESFEDKMESLGISKIYMRQPSLWALYYQMAKRSGAEQSLARDEACILKGVEGGGIANFKEDQQMIPPPKRAQPDRSYLNVGGILLKKKLWYYNQKHGFFLVAYTAQILLVIVIVYFTNLFLKFEPERLAKLIDTRMYENSHILVRSADNEGLRLAWGEAIRHILFKYNPQVKVEFLDYHDDIEAKLTASSAHSLTHERKQSIMAFSKDTHGFTCYHSSNTYHTAPIAAHAMMQAFMYFISPNQTNEYTTIMISHPFVEFTGVPSGTIQSVSSTVFAVFLSLTLCLMSVPIIRLLVVEKNCKLKMLQRMTGISSVVYWVSHGIGDTILYTILSIICCSIIFIVDEIGRHQYGNQERVVMCFVFILWLCWTSIPYLYFLTLVLDISTAGYGHILLLHFCLGARNKFNTRVIPKIVTFQLLRLRVTTAYTFLRYVLYLLPPYTITSACVHFFQAVGDEQWCNDYDKESCKKYESMIKRFKSNRLPSSSAPNEADINNLWNKMMFDDKYRTCCQKLCQTIGTCHVRREIFPTGLTDGLVPNLKHDMIGLILDGLVYWIMVILLEKEIIQRVFSFSVSKVCGNLEKTVASRDIKTTEEPDDVKEEHEKIDFMVEIEADVNTEVYLVQDVTKFYKYTKGLDHIFFSVPVKSITGILGLPKSGKTTLLDALVHHVVPSSGYIYKDNDLLDTKTKKNLLQNVGYCPSDLYQVPHLTGLQMMLIMGRLKGLSPADCETHAHWWLEQFGLKDVAKKPCKKYRQGQEKMLACAMALIGFSDMIIYDEPTLFMDSLERYIFWNIVSRLPAMNSTVLFTSTMADEVQNQSNKVLILESGGFAAIGHLHDIFRNNNQGMYVLIRYAIEDALELSRYQKKVKLDKVKDHIIQFLSPCALTEEQDNFLIYHLKNLTVKLSRVYAVMESAKVKFSSTILRYMSPLWTTSIFNFIEQRRRSDKSIMNIRNGMNLTFDDVLRISNINHDIVNIVIHDMVKIDDTDNSN